MLELRELSTSDETNVYNMLQRISKIENEFTNEANGKTYEEYKKWLKVQHNWSMGRDLPVGYVKQWTFWLVENNIPVGYGKIREKITEDSMQCGGNIGLSIDPLYRGKGYGNKLFELLLMKARELNVFEIYSTVEKYNYASQKIHLKYKGELLKEDEKRWYFYFDFRGNVNGKIALIKEK